MMPENTGRTMESKQSMATVDTAFEICPSPPSVIAYSRDKEIKMATMAVPPFNTPFTCDMNISLNDWIIFLISNFSLPVTIS
ncbi:hypothetical protein SDC9_198953 [bioreactor metagenome]|uniref:Uncharacterized protein n=1 Tax=bioreactor metagenome TaxID=1076179 RepID=A0A645IJK2_9ZZZZ